MCINVGNLETLEWWRTHHLFSQSGNCSILLRTPTQAYVHIPRDCMTMTTNRTSMNMISILTLPAFIRIYIHIWSHDTYHIHTSYMNIWICIYVYTYMYIHILYVHIYMTNVSHRIRWKVHPISRPAMDVDLAERVSGSYVSVEDARESKNVWYIFVQYVSYDKYIYIHHG